MAERLRAARYTARVAVRALAADLDVNPNSITAWERGALPGPDNRAKLAARFGVDEDTLFAEVAAIEAEAAALLRPA